MAIITKWFSTSAAGDGDGRDWDNRAALFDGSNTWSSIIDDFNHTSDSLLCLIGPGSYTCAESLSSSVSGATAANPIFLHACDSSGNILEPPDLNWLSAQPAWSTTNMPVITSSSNIATIGTGIYVSCRLIKFVATGRTGGAVCSPTAYQAAFDWCIVENQTSNTSASAMGGPANASNCVFVASGTSFSTVIGAPTESLLNNCRIEGNGSASSGNRYGIEFSGNAYARLSFFTIIGCPGGGCVFTGTSTVTFAAIRRSTILNCTAGGIIGNSTSSQTRSWLITNCYIANNGAYGINAAAGIPFVYGCRLRDNTSGNFNNFGNYPTTELNYTTDSDDATEFVDASGGDYRIKASSAIWGKGYGAGDEIPTAAAIATAVWARSGRSLTS